MTELKIVEDVASDAAARISTVAEAGGSIVLAGGSTPKQAYELASAADWSTAKVWFGDERCVPPGDERSNFRMAKESLFDRLAAPPAAIFRMPGELDPAEAAHQYAADIFEHDAEPFDLLLLGIGSDGHTASLFPGKPEISQRNLLVTAVPEPGLDPLVPRVSLTVPALVRAKEILFLVVGPGKAAPVKESFGTENSMTPAGIVARKARGRVTVLLDQAAAADL
ncbi:MAG: 6-phosphogluconolactonase [Thermoleophilaceae bacterium]|nr:6-phosphogluconolactonase [Thermoleophilaceae bacterium]